MQTINRKGTYAANSIFEKTSECLYTINCWVFSLSYCLNRFSESSIFRIYSVDFSPDGEQLLVTAGNIILVWKNLLEILLSTDLHEASTIHGLQSHSQCHLIL